MKINRFNETVTSNDKSAKNVEELFSKESDKYDKKSKLNKAEKVFFDKDFMNKILSDGLTYEDMSELKAPVLRYTTQMTVHGVFPQFDEYGIGGYANLVLNKNGSLGIKYNAIDYKKKEDLSRKIITLKYVRNSKENYFYKTASDLESVKEIYDRIDTSLFIGNKYLNKFDFLGRTYYIALVYIYCFPIGNLQKIADQINGLSEKEVSDIRDKENKEREEYYAKMKLKNEADKEEKKNDYDKIISELEVKFKKPVLFDSNQEVLLGVKQGYSEVEYYLVRYNGKKGAYHSVSLVRTDLDDLDVSEIDSYRANKQSDKDQEALFKRLNRNYTFFKI